MTSPNSTHARRRQRTSGGSVKICGEKFIGRNIHNWKQTTTEDEGAATSEPVRGLRASTGEDPSDSEIPVIQSGESLFCAIQGITSRWSCPAPRPKCKQEDDNQQPSVRIRMATGGKLNRIRKVLKRFISGNSSREDDRDMGSKILKRGQTESNVPMESGPAAEKEEQIQPSDSDVRDTNQESGTSTREVIACQLGSSLITELSRPHQGAEPEFTISDLLAEGGEYRLYQLTKFYRDRLKQAIEEKVERLGWMLTKEGHFSREENEASIVCVLSPNCWYHR
ncbi:uncharacterized protein LOC132389012 [Hypanus sabinus]|uniref:uncharacterized protein LOC132389012 n=1 Tax=Hypanus sabinus TaxID=79690 RepID=UPI0028C4CAC0|nr:uncharacterized protein LOC132389012 [Hypanus sabinus]